MRTMIADSGIGIQPEALASVFEPFQRLGAEHTEIEGAGLGLALSKGLIEAMGGTIEVESALGVGTAFVIELAGAERPTAEQESGPSDQLAGVGAPDAGGQLILYIEDNLSNLTLVERILERRGRVELISAMQGRIGLDLARQHRPDLIGLDLARQHRPDLIVLDLHLPDIQGSSPAPDVSPVVVRGVSGERRR